MTIRVLGVDPGFRSTGWGVIDVDGPRLRHVADGVVKIAADQPVAARLAGLYDALAEVIAEYRPQEAAVEETFVNKNAASALKLGQARGLRLWCRQPPGLASPNIRPT